MGLEFERDFYIKVLLWVDIFRFSGHLLFLFQIIVTGLHDIWTTDKLMSWGEQNEHQQIERSIYLYENIKIKKGRGSRLGSIQQ